MVQLDTLYQKGECLKKKKCVIQGRGRAYHRCTMTKQQVSMHLIFSNNKQPDNHYRSAILTAQEKKNLHLS